MSTSSFQVACDKALTNLRVQKVSVVGERLATSNLVVGVVDADTIVAGSLVGGFQEATSTAENGGHVTWDGSYLVWANSEYAELILTIPAALSTKGRNMIIIFTNAPTSSDNNVRVQVEAGCSINGNPGGDLFISYSVPVEFTGMPTSGVCGEGRDWYFTGTAYY